MRSPRTYARRQVRPTQGIRLSRGSGLSQFAPAAGARGRAECPSPNAHAVLSCCMEDPQNHAVPRHAARSNHRRTQAARSPPSTHRCRCCTCCARNGEHRLRDALKWNITCLRNESVLLCVCALSAPVVTTAALLVVAACRGTTLGHASTVASCDDASTPACGLCDQTLHAFCVQGQWYCPPVEPPIHCQNDASFPDATDSAFAEPPPLPPDPFGVACGSGYCAPGNACVPVPSEDEPACVPIPATCADAAPCYCIALGQSVQTTCERQSLNEGCSPSDAGAVYGLLLPLVIAALNPASAHWPA